jgi:alpha-tubulin suppressor-like RCC1 family protein
MADVWMRSVAAHSNHSLALDWDGRVYSWGKNEYGQLGHGDGPGRRSPALVEGLEGVRGIATDCNRSLAVTQWGAVFHWGKSFLPEAENELRPTIVEGFEGVRVRRVSAGLGAIFAIGENGRVFLWGDGFFALSTHDDTRLLYPPFQPKRVEGLRGVRVSSIAVGRYHALALAEDGLVYAWGENAYGVTLGNPHVQWELLPTPVEALHGVFVGGIAAAGLRSYAVTDTCEVWAWGRDRGDNPPLGHGAEMECPLPKVIESLRGVKVDAVATGGIHTLALADDGSVHAWGCEGATAGTGALGLGRWAGDEDGTVPTPQPIPALRVATCGVWPVTEFTQASGANATAPQATAAQTASQQAAGDPASPDAPASQAGAELAAANVRDMLVGEPEPECTSAPRQRRGGVWSCSLQ